jgi:hypothetical protein
MVSNKPPPIVARTFLSARVTEGRQECLPHIIMLHRYGLKGYLE